MPISNHTPEKMHQFECTIQKAATTIVKQIEASTVSLPLLANYRTHLMRQKMNCDTKGSIIGSLLCAHNLQNWTRRRLAHKVVDLFSVGVLETELVVLVLHWFIFTRASINDLASSFKLVCIAIWRLEVLFCFQFETFCARVDVLMCRQTWMNSL